MPKGKIKREERICGNCNCSELYKVPLVYAKVVLSSAGNNLDESDYWSLILCKNTKSDHNLHFVSIFHFCRDHSDNPL